MCIKHTLQISHACESWPSVHAHKHTVHPHKHQLILSLSPSHRWQLLLLVFSPKRLTPLQTPLLIPNQTCISLVHPTSAHNSNTSFQMEHNHCLLMYFMWSQFYSYLPFLNILRQWTKQPFFSAHSMISFFSPKTMKWLSISFWVETKVLTLYRILLSPSFFDNFKGSTFAYHIPATNPLSCLWNMPGILFLGPSALTDTGKTNILNFFKNLLKCHFLSDFSTSNYWKYSPVALNYSVFLSQTISPFMILHIKLSIT